MGRRVLIALAAINAVLIGALGVTIVRGRAAEWNGTLLEPPMVAQPFSLVSADGPVSSSDLHGQWTLLFFGYTRCPDACPMTLEKLRRVHGALGSRAAQVQVVLVTVDPEYDTPDVLADYVARFEPSFLGLSADAPTIEALAETYGIFHEVQARDAVAHEGHAASAAPEASHAEATGPGSGRGDGQSGTQHDAHVSHDVSPPFEANSGDPAAVPNIRIAHTTHVLVLDRDGRLAMLWGPELTADQMTSDLRRLLRR